MKKLMMILAMMVAIATSASAMSYKEARREALFLTDKMAYELNLTDDQYEAAYEINLDYLMSVNHRRHLYGSYWSRRNTLFRIILAPWQYSVYIRANYFYRPVYWANNRWSWRIYNRYGHHHYYRARPRAYVHYCGGRPIHYYKNHKWNKPSRPHDDVYMRRNGSHSHFDKYMKQNDRKFGKSRGHNNIYKKNMKGRKFGNNGHNRGNHNGHRK
ncbi:MAG: hypothetical protein ACOYJK_03770 [Prevotella sp.]|jgi:hypothetical protein